MQIKIRERRLLYAGKMIRSQTAKQEQQLESFLARHDAANPFPEDVLLTADADYMGDGRPCHRMDIFRPREAKEALPVLVNIHGGGFLLGKKEVNRLFCADMCRRARPGLWRGRFQALPLRRQRGRVSLRVSRGDAQKRRHGACRSFPRTSRRWASSPACFMALTSEAISMLKEKNVKSVLVSIDHILPEYHDAFRGVEGCYARAIEAIKECVSKKISTTIGFTPRIGGSH